jgi:PRC-barrel domain
MNWGIGLSINPKVPHVRARPGCPCAPWDAARMQDPTGRSGVVAPFGDSIIAGGKGPRMSCPDVVAVKRPGRQMRDRYRLTAAMALIALSPTVYTAVQDSVAAQPQIEQLPNDPGKAPIAPPQGAIVTVFDNREVQGILGTEVRSVVDENMGRIVNIMVDRTGQVRAAVIDFGGFLGVGSRKIAVAWNVLHFLPDAKKGGRVALELTRDQVRGAPEFKEDKPVVVLGASGSVELLPFP